MFNRVLAFFILFHFAFPFGLNAEPNSILQRLRDLQPYRKQRLALSVESEWWEKRNQIMNGLSPMDFSYGADDGLAYRTLMYLGPPEAKLSEESHEAYLKLFHVLKQRYGLEPGSFAVSGNESWTSKMFSFWLSRLRPPEQIGCFQLFL